MSELVPDGFPFPLAEPEPEPMLVTCPCGCTSMVIDGQPVQVSWCVPHDPGYPPPFTAPEHDLHEAGYRDHDPATCRDGDHYGQCSGVTR